MKRGLTITSLSFLFFAKALFSQTTNSQTLGAPSERQLGLGFDLHLAQTRDETLAPIRWTGGRLNFLLEYQLNSAAQSHLAYLRFPSVGFLMERYKNEAIYLGYHAGYLYLRNTSLGNPHLQVKLGGGIDARMNLHWFARWDDSHFYWVTAYSPGFASQVSFQQKDRKLSLSFFVSFLAYASRNEIYRLYKIDPMTKPLQFFPMAHQDMRLYFTPDFFYGKIKLTYHNAFRKGAPIPSYEVSFLKIEQPAPAALLDHTFQLKWGKKW